MEIYAIVVTAIYLIRMFFGDNPKDWIADYLLILPLLGRAAGWF